MLNLLIPLQPEDKIIEETLQAFSIGVLTDVLLLGAVFIAFVIFTKIVWNRWDP